MADRVLIDFDPVTGTRTYFHGHGDGRGNEPGGFDLITEADCEPVLDANKALAGGTGREHWKGDFRKEASIPNVILMKWLAEDGIEFWTEEGKERIVAKLNNPEWKYLKTANVTIG